MINNWNTELAWRYHNGTKHPGGNLMDPGHDYDYSMKPLLFKIYTGLEPIPLPLDITPEGMPALEAISGSVSFPSSSSKSAADAAGLDFAALARILFFSAGITKHLRHPRLGDFPFRAAACTGALYHIELYVVCGNLPGVSQEGLEAGVYHFDPSQNVLRRLRRGDFRPAVAMAGGGDPVLEHAPAILVYTDVFYRNAVKYQARAYRHSFWDCGTILSNTLAMAAAQDLPARVVTGFVDGQINRLLDLDEQREAALALVALGTGQRSGLETSPEIPPLALEVLPIAEKERFFPAIYEMHRASSLAEPAEVESWRERARQFVPLASGSASSEVEIPLRSLTGDALSKDPVEKVIIRRGSTRRFTRDAITFEQLSTLLSRSLRGIPTDLLESSSASLNQLYLIVHAVDGLEPGSYVYNRPHEALERLRSGEFRREAGELALGQDLAADASVNVYFLADLGPIFEHLGNRGYRLAQLEASLTAGKMYLAAYAQRFGATGLTFFDDMVTDFFSPHAANKSVMFLIALGVPERKRREKPPEGSGS